MVVPSDAAGCVASQDGGAMGTCQAHHCTVHRLTKGQNHSNDQVITSLELPAIITIPPPLKGGGVLCHQNVLLCVLSRQFSFFFFFFQVIFLFASDLSFHGNSAFLSTFVSLQMVVAFHNFLHPKMMGK